MTVRWRCRGCGRLTTDIARHAAQHGRGHRAFDRDMPLDAEMRDEMRSVDDGFEDALVRAIARVEHRTPGPVEIFDRGWAALADRLVDQGRLTGDGHGRYSTVLELSEAA